MAGEAIWSEPAEAQLKDYVAYINQRAPTLAREAAEELRAAADLVARRPGIARKARWESLWEWSVGRWRKLLVLQREGEVVRVLAMYDLRQDLTKVDPFPK